MALSQRERYIAIGSIAAIAILGGDKLVVSPYLDTRADVIRRDTDAKQILANNEDVLHKRNRLKHVWDEMQSGGLKSDRSQAESQGYTALQNFAQWSAVNFPNRKADQHAVTHGKFQVIRFNVSGDATQLSLAKFLWAAESTSVPMRVTDLQATPRPEGLDRLQVQMTIATLCLAPDTDKPRPAPVSGGE